MANGPSILEPAFEIDDKKRSDTSKQFRLENGIRAWDSEDIGTFKPERWLIQAADGSLQFDPSAGPQFAFGLGIRGCFGKKLAHLELRILLVLVVWNFELLKCPAELSGYAARTGLTREPKQCYGRLRRVSIH